DTNPLRVVWSYRFVIPFLLAAPAVAMLTLGPPWVDLAAGVDPALASVRNLLVIAVGGGYIRTTSITDSRAAIQRTVPGRPGQFLGLGIELVARFLPVLRRDLLAIRDAEAARLGTDRPLRERMSTLATAGLNRAFRRADRLSAAMQARCLSWNPTLPPLRFGWVDLPVVGLSVLLLGASVAQFVGIGPAG
ncbi:MAG: energy-coupling factor transporter transmembrane component T, partial [Halohasta sp.]